MTLAHPLTCPDDEFSEFMHSHGFDMSGVDSKEDAERIISLLDNVALPDFSGYKYYMSSLRFDNNAFTIWYSRADRHLLHVCNHYCYRKPARRRTQKI